MEIDWKEFWRKCWAFNKKVEAEESTAADVVAFLLYLPGFGLLFYGATNFAVWAFVTGLVSLVISALIFQINTTVAQCKVAKQIDNDRQ